jgi:ketosteroid isomerase-like protein
LAERELTLAREGYEAWNRGDSDWFLEHMTEDAEVRPLRDFDDFDELYRGHKGWKKFWKAWRRQWSRVEVRVERMQDMGEHGVLVLLTLEGVGKESDEEVSIPVSHWLKFREGLIASITVMAPDAAERRYAERD